MTRTNNITIAILAIPKNVLKIRYIILRQVGSREQILSRKNWFMTNQDKTYARLMFLLQSSVKPTISTILKE